MIKDRGQKRLAARYCAVQGILPFAEVIVRSSTSVDDSPVDITDIDVLGLDMTNSGLVRRILFDCKTAKQSGINRALWLSGLRHLISADAGFIIQTKLVPDTHRLAALAMSINIHSEDSFRRYASSLNIDFDREVTYLDDMERWDELLAVNKNNSSLSDLNMFIGTQSALERSGPRGLRTGLGAIMKASGELDPRKSVHRMIFGCALSSFLHHTAVSLSIFKDVFDFAMPKREFEQRLRYFLWEGRENYELRLKLRRALSERGSENGDKTVDFDLPEWPRLLELMRGYLESPDALHQLPLISKELAFRAGSGTKRPDADVRLKRMIASNNRARQFIFSASNYLVHAAALPREFSRLLESDINDLLADRL